MSEIVIDVNYIKHWILENLTEEELASLYQQKAELDKKELNDLIMNHSYVIDRENVIKIEIFWNDGGYSFITYPVKFFNDNPVIKLLCMYLNEEKEELSFDINYEDGGKIALLKEMLVEEGLAFYYQDNGMCSYIEDINIIKYGNQGTAHLMQIPTFEMLEKINPIYTKEYVIEYLYSLLKEYMKE